ncbi:MAG: ABC transporter permease, partial [Chitinophaga rupis]
MLNNYIKLAWRNLSKQRFYTALNIIGLSLGIAGGLLLFQFIRFHLSFDRRYQKDGQLYRVVTELHLDDGSVVHEKGSPFPLTAALQGEASQVKDHAVLLNMRSITIGVPGGSSDNPRFFSEEGNVAFTDAHWFNLFDYTWIKGSPSASLTAPSTAVITRKLADKYFGKDDPIGKTIRLNDKFPVIITGLLEDYPDNTDLKVDM